MNGAKYRVVSHLLVTALTAITICGCSGDDSPTESQGQRTGTVYGWVQSTFTAVNVLGAVVTAGGVTDVSHGEFSAFRLEDVPAGDHLLTATATGYDVYTDTITVVAGESRQIGQIWLKPTTLTGTGIVYGWFWIEGTSDGVSGINVSCGGSTDTTVWDGSYYLLHIPPGSHTFTATGNGYHPYSTDLTIKADSTHWHFFRLRPQ